jgi:hypothetical protein
MPQRTLEDSIKVADVIYKNFAGGETPLGTIAKIIGVAEKSSNMRYVISACESYGIIDKSNKGYALSEIGRKIIAPTYQGEDREAIKKAILTPTLMSKIYSDYDKHPIPEDSFFLNALEQKYAVPKAKAAEIRDILIKNAEYAGIITISNDGNTRLLNLNNDITKSVIQNAQVTYVPTITNAGDDIIDLVPSYEDNEHVDYSKTCFIITPIGADDSIERKHANMMLNHLVKPVCEELGLIVVRADMIDKAGLITQQILDYIAKSGFCIADLSFNNPNVFYELGVRHVCQLPTIQIIRKGDKIPFDVSQGRTIIIDTSDIYSIMDRFESGRKELKEHLNKQTNNIKNDIADDNPIKIYLPDLKVTLPKHK